MNLAANAVSELCKPRPSSETVEYTTKDFVKTLDGVDKCLSEQIQYLTQVSTMQPHEGSVYGPEKDYELSYFQTALAKERLQRLQGASSPRQLNGRSSASLPPPSLPPPSSHPL
ncbi:Mediator of RNA polymerase II transcription subunit 11 [Geodia barretti]|nr:Mediator of RNA polymerase II transcription subunit 11 [Geodia barretti]